MQVLALALSHPAVLGGGRIYVVGAGESGRPWVERLARLFS